MKLLLVIILFILVGCARTAYLEPTSVSFDRSAGQFPPAKVFYNRNVPVARYYVSRLEAVEAALKETGAFFDLGQHVRSPIILDIELASDDADADTAMDYAAAALSGATLSLVPTKNQVITTLKVDVYGKGQLIGSYKFHQEYEQVDALFNLQERVNEETNEFRAIRNLVNRFVNQLHSDNILPKVRLENQERQPQNTKNDSDERANNWLRPGPHPLRG